MRQLTSTVLLAALLAGAASAQTLVATLSGNPGGRFGTAVASAGFSDADTYADLLVGMPGNLTGAIYCISGQYLATGAGSSTLWIVSGPSGSGGSFGSAIASAGNLTGNSATDFIVSAPDARLVPTSGITNGAVHLVDGSTHAIVATIYGDSNTRLGAVVVSVGDQNGDGKSEFAVTAPSTNTTSASYVHVIQGSTFVGTKNLSATAHSTLNSNGANEFGETLAANFDLDGNGKKDLAIGSPRMFGSGFVYFVSADGQFTTLATYTGSGGGERMGASISGTHDYDGDGVVDFVVGAPNWSTNHATADGRAVVLSGAKLRSFTLPYELASYALTTGGVATYRFGAEVCASPDLDRDGVGDFLIGAPDFHTVFPAGPDRGAVFVYSGATLSQLVAFGGANGDDNLGSEILGAFQDVTGDLFPEFVVAASAADNPATDCGLIKLYSVTPIAPNSYCTGKTNSLGCTPSISWSGTASVSSTAPFTLSCVNAINQVPGLFFYSHAPAAAPFQGGTMCVALPTKRTGLLTSGGSASGVDCTGVLAYDFNARIDSGVDASLVSAAQIYIQCWSRDSASPSTTSLSNGVHFMINP